MYGCVCVHVICVYVSYDGDERCINARYINCKSQISFFAVHVCLMCTLLWSYCGTAPSSGPSFIRRQSEKVILAVYRLFPYRTHHKQACSGQVEPEYRPDPVQALVKEDVFYRTK